MPTRLRREPPPFRAAKVTEVTRRSPHLVAVTMAGPELDGLDPGLPAASVRLLLPPPGRDEVVLPSWDGNEFLYEDGSRPDIRTLTPRRVAVTGADPSLDVEIVLHGEGPMSAWAETVRPGSQAAVSGTGRGYEVDPAMQHLLLAGDETAIPAISVLLEALPDDTVVQVLVEVGRPDARVELPGHPGADVTWLDLPPGSPAGEALVGAVTRADLPDDPRVWAAGEAAAVQRIRRHLFDERGLSRRQAVVRGYWKRGRSADAAGGDSDT